MLGALGCLTPELLAKYQGINFPEPVWFRTGAQILGNGSIDYLGQPGIIHAQSIVFTLATQVWLRTFNLTRAPTVLTCNDFGHLTGAQEPEPENCVLPDCRAERTSCLQDCMRASQDFQQPAAPRMPGTQILDSLHNAIPSDQRATEVGFQTVQYTHKFPL